MKRSEDLLFFMRSLEVFIYLSVSPDPILALTRGMGLGSERLDAYQSHDRSGVIQETSPRMLPSKNGEAIQVCISRHLERSSFKVTVLTSQSYHSSTVNRIGIMVTLEVQEGRVV